MTRLMTEADSRQKSFLGDGARWRTRTSDPFHVKEVLYH